VTVEPSEQVMPVGAAETTWLEGIIEVASQVTPKGPVLFITLSNNHRYALPLFGPVREAVHRIASPITIADATQVNGNGAKLTGQ